MTPRRTSPSPPRGLRPLLWRLDTPAGLAAMFAAAFVIRLAIAPHIGFFIDLGYFRTWATELRDVGPHRFYSVDHLADYPPGYLYVLWLIGKISATPGYLLLKLPALIGDLGLAWIAGTFASRLAPTSIKERLPVRAVVAAAVLFNPAVIALSAVWGQVDVVPAMFVLWSLLLLFTGPRTLPRDLAAFGLFGVAFAMKPQTSFALPVMLYALYRRYLHRRTRAALIDGALSIALMGVLSLGVWAVSGLAFGLGPVSLYHFYTHSASVHPVTSANAFNLWGVVGSWRNDATGIHVMTIAGMPALRFGMLLFGVAIVAVLVGLHRAIERGMNEARTLTLGAAVASLLGYTLLTRMHERYLFVSLALFAPLILARPLRRTYVALSALFVLNLWFAFAYYNSQVKVEALKLDPVYGWIFGGFAFDTWQKRILSLAVTAIALAVAWRGVRWTGAWQPERRQPRARLLSVLPSAVRLLRPGPPPEPTAAHGPAADLWARLRALRESALPEQTAARALIGKGSRWWPLTLVALACAFGLIVLRGETTPALNLNDSAFHLQMVHWADGQIAEGRVPLDGWYPNLSLGSSFFHHYQSLPHTLTAYTARATGASDGTTYLWFQYLLLALWPIAVYLGARLLGWGRWTAAAAAAVSPLIVSTPGYGYEHGSYTWQGYGVYSQLWAMWLLPITWGLTWRAVSHGKHYAAAAAALALTIACHFITGYLAVLTLGVWVIVLGRSGFLRRAGRAALVAGGSMLVASWVLVPLVGDTKWTNQSAFYKGSIFNDSYGASKILGWLFTGNLFDHGRFPLITVLFFVGVLRCLVRAWSDVRARVLLGAFTLSLLLFFGRPTWGRALDLLPGFGDVQIHRFVMGVDLAAIMIAGVGLGWLLRTASSMAGRLVDEWAVPGRIAVVAGAISLLLCIGVLEPAWAERARYDRRGTHAIGAQRIADVTDGRDLDKLIAIVKSRGDGRVYGGLRGNWGLQYRVGSVPVHVWLVDRDVDSIGFVFRTIGSLSTDIEASFDDTNLAQYQMLNIRYLILPADRQPSVPAKLLASSGRHRLYEVQTTGYFQVVDRAPAVTANRTDLGQATLAFRQSDLASRGIYPGVAFAGGAAPQPTFAGASPPEGPAGQVQTQTATLQDGVFTATVEANRAAVVLLKASYDPRWTVTVDGLPDKPAMMAPSLVGVQVPAGRHVVRFKYEPYGQYPLLLAIGAITLLGLAIYPRRAALRLRFFTRKPSVEEESRDAPLFKRPPADTRRS